MFIRSGYHFRQLLLLFLAGFLCGIWCISTFNFIIALSIDQGPSHLLQEANSVHCTNDYPRNAKKAERLLCWILTSPKTISRAHLIKKTWGRRCDTLLFMSSEFDATVPTVALAVNDTYHTLWGKTQEALRYIYDHHLDDAEWFFKADDDTYAIVENLRQMISNYDSSLPMYIGHRFHYAMRNLENGYNTGGAGYLLTRETIRRFIELGYENQFPMCRPEQEGEEDVELARCLETIGVTYGDSLDSEGRQRMLQHSVGHIATNENVQNWLRTYEFFPFQKGLEYISKFAVSFHYVRDEELLTYEYLINELLVAK